MSTSTEPVRDHPPIPPRSRRRPPVPVLLLLLVLVVVLIGASLLWLWVESHQQPGGVAVSPTATATAPPTWVPTPITPPARALFYDTFVNNDAGWSVSNDNQNGYYRILVDNFLSLSATRPDTTLVESVPTNTNLSDYMLSADFTINQATANDSIGFYLRGTSNLDNDYRVDVYGNNTLAVAKEWLDKRSDQVDEKTTMLYNPHYTSLLHPPGQSNTLSVIALGPTLVVSVNSIVVVQLTDSSYTSGQIALFAHNDGDPHGVTVSFTRVEVDRLASPFDTPVPTPTATPTSQP